MTRPRGRSEAALFAGVALARRLEMVEAQAFVRWARASAHLYPGNGAAIKPIAGGFAVFTGREKPFSRASGVGMRGRVTAGDIARLDGFYRQRLALPRVEVCPFAHASLVERLNAHGFRVRACSNLLFVPLAGAASHAGSGVDVRLVAAGERVLWRDTVARGFNEGRDPDLLGLQVAWTQLHGEGVRCFLARVNGELAGGGGVLLLEGTALFFGTSTLPRHRRCGVHAALIHARLEHARRAGCDLAMVRTLPGSNSQRNLERQGFRVAYTRSGWVGEPRDSTPRGSAPRVPARRGRASSRRPMLRG